MDDMPLGLTRQTTYAKLSAEELESMGKQAAVAYLTRSSPSLNDAIIKVAKQHPSISTHQVRRIAEFANTETFSQLFADNVKYASDKNIDFNVADPGHILHELNDGAKPQFLMAPPDEYSTDPVKMSSAEAVEADLVLTRMFMGVDPASPGSEKTVLAQVALKPDGEVFHVDHILLTDWEKIASSVSDRIISAGEQSAKPDPSALQTVQHSDGGEQTYDEAAQHEKVSMGGMEDMPMGPAAGGGGEVQMDTTQHPEITHQSNIRALDRRVEIEKKKQELVTMQAKGLQAMGDQGGTPGAMAGAPDAMAGPPAEAPPPEAAPAGAGAPPAEAPMEGMPQEAGMEAMPPQAAAPAGGPGGMEPAPNMPVPGENMKKASALTKEAMVYAKSNRPNAGAVLDDLRQATSVENIRKMAAAKLQYKSSNPYGELIRTKQKVARLLEDAVAARDMNQEYYKEASAQFSSAVVRHLHDGGGLGEVTQMMSHINPHEGAIKVGMTIVIPEVKKHGFDLAKLQADSIRHEMEKGAAVRTVNPEHPVAQGYYRLLEVAGNQQLLNKSASGLQVKFGEIEEVLKEVMVRHAAAS
jgi:hypothetical protein